MPGQTPTATDAEMGLAGKGYPDMGFPFGWEWNQRLKRMHRGDIIGMSGRWLAAISAFAGVYLAISGPVLYFQAWRRRYRSGRRALLWKMGPVGPEFAQGLTECRIGSSRPPPQTPEWRPPSS